MSVKMIMDQLKPLNKLRKLHALARKDEYNPESIFNFCTYPLRLERFIKDNKDLDLSSVISLGLVLPHNFQVKQDYFHKVPNLKTLYLRIKYHIIPFLFFYTQVLWNLPSLSFHLYYSFQKILMKSSIYLYPFIGKLTIPLLLFYPQKGS